MASTELVVCGGFSSLKYKNITKLTIAATIAPIVKRDCAEPLLRESDIGFMIIGEKNMAKLFADRNIEIAKVADAGPADLATRVSPAGIATEMPAPATI